MQKERIKIKGTQKDGYRVQDIIPIISGSELLKFNSEQMQQRKTVEGRREIAEELEKERNK